MAMEFTHKFKATRKYTKYYQDSELVDEVLAYFRDHDPNTYSLRDVANSTNIEYSVLCKWRINFNKDHTYRPGGKYGSHRRRFTDVQERAVADLIRIQYVVSGIIVRRKNLKAILFDLWKTFDPETRVRVQHNFFQSLRHQFL